MAGRRKLDDGFVRETFSLPRDKARTKARDFLARYPKAAFPTAEVYGPTPDAQLRLITCGGDFDRSRRGYADNVVVFARQGP